MKKKKLIATIVISSTALVLTSTGVTLAWFNNNAKGNVEGFNMVVSGDPDLYISTDGVNFTDKLTKADLIQVDKFNPVSSAYSDRWLIEKPDMPKFTEDFEYVNPYSVPTYAKTGFYSQELYLRSKDNIVVTIDPTSGFFTADQAKNEEAYETVKDQYPELSKEQILDNLNSIYKSMRVSVLYKTENSFSYVIIDPTKTEETYLGGVLDVNLDGKFDYGTANEVVYGDYKNRDKLVFDAPVSQDIPYSGQLTCFNSGRAANIGLFNLEKSIDAGAEIATENSVAISDITNALKIKLFDKIPTKIVLSIYLEGWDKDNTELMKHASFNADIKFKIQGELIQ